ncbi:MAG: FtsX-like permease family protein [Dehalococcoidia bacterium]
MRGMVRIWRLFSRRSGRNWRLLAVLALGMIMAATLLASAPVYARTMADLGLTFIVREDLNDTPGNRVQFPAIPLATTEGTNLKTAVADRIEQRIGWFDAYEARYLRTGRFFTGENKDDITWFAPQGQIQSLTGLQDHVEVLEGEFPKPTAAGEPIEVAMSREAADAAKLKVGQELWMVEDFDDCAREIPDPNKPPPPPCTPIVGITYSFRARLTAIIEPIEDPAYWVTLLSYYFDPFSVGLEEGIVVPMFTTEETMLNNFAVAHPAYMAETGWYTYADPELLTKANFERASSDLTTLYKEFEPLGGASFSPLTGVLEDYRDSASYQQTPLTILLLEVAAVALFYVILIALVIVERQADEIALLRSRGATTFQIAVMYLLEGLILGIPCILIAPFLSAAATAVLGLSPTFENVNGGELLPTTIPLSSFGYAAGGVLLSIVVLLIPAVMVARRSAVVRRREQARPGVSFLQRYYLDLALAGVAGLLLFELQERGSVFEPSATGGVSSDPLLLASPAILMLAAAALLLRFYPMLLRAGARIFGRRATPSVAVGLWQVARSPGNSARLALLLTMAVAVGTFAASYSATAKKTFDERAKFNSGVEWRAGVRGGTNELGLNGEKVDARLSALDGVDYATAVIRTTGAPAVSGVSARNFQVLGVDPDRASEMLWYRDDFADRPLRDLMADLGSPEPLKGLTLPPGTRSIKIKVGSSQDGAIQTLWANVADKDHVFQLLQLGDLPGPGYHELTADIRKSPSGEYEEPLRLVSFIFTEPPNRFINRDLTVYFDDIVAVNEAGEETLLDGFENGKVSWAMIPDLKVGDTYEVVHDEVASGNGAAKLTHKAGQSTSLWGLYVGQDNIPLPVVASESFAAATGIHKGGSGLMDISGILVPITIKDTYRLMPTLDTRDGPSVVFNRDHLLSWIGTVDFLVSPGINEGWFSLKPGADTGALRKSLAGPPFYLDDVSDQKSELSSLERNPLIAAGGAGILYIAFGAVLLLVAAALLVSLWVSVQRRRSEFAVLRAMGLSRGGVVQLLAFEYALVAILGLFAGGYLGRLVGERMLSFLNVDDKGDRAEPGFLLQTEWLLVAAGGAIVLAVFVAALIFAGRLISRTSDAAALRTE